MPEGWSWCRLGNITDTIQYGLNNSAEQSGTYRFLRITDIQNGKVNWDIVPFTNTNESAKYLLHINDIVFARTGATVGKSFLITELPYETVYASYLIRIRLIGEILPQYIYQFFNSQCYWKQITGKAVGVGQPNCNGTSLKELFIPFPPLSEQERILSIAEAILEYVDIISQEEVTLVNLINNTKSKILDLAIRGKLVPQDPNDEPASALLERIRAEKEELIKQGKIKRDKKASIIFRGDDNSYYEKQDNEYVCIDGDIPYCVPNGWEWCTLGICCQKTIKRGKSPKYSTEGNTLVFAQKCNTKHNGIDLSLALKLEKTMLTKYSDEEFMIDEDIVINSTGTGTLGRVGIYKDSDNYNHAQIVPDSHVTVIRTHSLISSKYVYAFLKYNQPLLEKMGEGSTNQKELKPISLINLRIPIPPLEEQKRIVDKVAMLLNCINSIEVNLV